MRRMDAGRTYLVYSASTAVLFLLTFTIYGVFAITRLGLDPLQLVLLGSILELTYLLAEVPTGVVADLVSRRLSVIIGIVGSGAAFVLLGLSHSFWPAAISQVIWGIAAALQAGADVAWITDELGEENARPLYLKAGQVGNVGALVGIVAAVILASVDLALPILVTGVGLIFFGVWLAAFMPEEHFTPHPRSEGERLHTGFVTTFRDGVHQVRTHQVLLLVFASAALHGASTEGFDRLADYHLIRDIGLPAIGDLDRVVWFGLLGAASLVLGIGAMAFVKRRAYLEGDVHVTRVLTWIDVVLTAMVLVFAFAGSFVLAVVAYLVAGALRGVRGPIFTAWINQGLDPRTRATINSMGGQADAIGQVAGGPVLGVIGNRSVPIALGVSGLLKLPALLLYARARRRGSARTDRSPEEKAVELDAGS